MPSSTDSWIDNISRALHVNPGCSHRRIGLSAVALALTGQALPDDALAACRKPGKTCTKNTDCCDGAKCK